MVKTLLFSKKPFMSQFETILHWVYVAVMFGSAILFQLLSGAPRDVPAYKYMIHTFIVVWSGLAYAAMAFGQGSVIAEGQTVHYARYIDWVITTPLLLLSLTLTAKYTIEVKGTLTAALLGTQAIMIITGLLAELSPKDIQWFWYATGCLALVVVLYLIWQPLRRKTFLQDKEIELVYRKSALFLTIQWLAYPMVWMIGSMGLQIMNESTTTLLFIILPIVSKAGFGFFNLFLLRALPATVKEK
jgi:bacteriorhodopsin